VTLSQAAVGQQLLVKRTGLDPTDQLRLAELGIRPGEQVKLLQRGVWCGLVLAVGGLRVALDQGTARSIVVAPVPAAQLGQ